MSQAVRENWPVLKDDATFEVLICSRSLAGSVVGSLHMKAVNMANLGTQSCLRSRGEYLSATFAFTVTADNGWWILAPVHKGRAECSNLTLRTNNSDSSSCSNEIRSREQLEVRLLSPRDRFRGGGSGGVSPRPHGSRTWGTSRLP
jgi:hypothetical protein